MTAMLPCEYCGRMTPWNLSYCVPACCQDCGCMPLILGNAWFIFSVVVAVLGIIAWRHFT